MGMGQEKAMERLSADPIGENPPNRSMTTSQDGETLPISPPCKRKIIDTRTSYLIARAKRLT
jgi:hypothetical protein